MLLVSGQAAYAASTAGCFDTDTVLYLRANGTDASTTFRDYSATGRTITAQADTQVDTAQSKFGGASALFDGTGDYASAPDSDDWNLGSGAFTVEAWVRFNNIAAAREIVGQFDTNNQRGWTLDWNNTNELRLLYTTDGTAGTQTIETFSWTPSTGVWYHVAITRSGNDLKAFIDGTQIGTTKTLSATIFNSSSVLTIGAILSTGSPINLMNGWLDDIRIVKGTAVWTANFTAPSREFRNCKKISIN